MRLHQRCVSHVEFLMFYLRRMSPISLNRKQVTSIVLHWVRCLLEATAERRGRVVYTPASYSRSTGFKSQT
jgi:hypothetical protein